MRGPTKSRSVSVIIVAIKKADVVKHPEVFDHVGLLFNEPSAEADCPSSSHPTIHFIRREPVELHLDRTITGSDGKASRILFLAFACRSDPL